MNEAALENTDGLADTEIARLITLSNQASYSRSDIVPVREPSPFEPKSLVEIAMAAQKRRDEANAHAAAEKVLSDQNTTQETADEQVASSAESAGETPDDAAAIVSEETTETPAADDASSTPPQQDIASDQAADAGTDAQSNADETADVADTPNEGQTDTQTASPVQTQSVPIAPAIPDPSLLEAEYKRGQEAGLAEGQAKAAEQLEKVLQNFEQAILALAKPEALDVSALSAQIASRVMALASDRAGQAITDMPEPFAKRVEDLINMVKSETATPTIHFNAEDHASIKPLAQNRDKLKNCKFVVDDALARGDIKMSVGGIGLIDEMSDRTNSRMADDEADTSQLTEEVKDIAETASQPDISTTDVNATSTIDTVDTKAENLDAPTEDKTVDETDSPEALIEEKGESKVEKAEASAEDKSEAPLSSDKDTFGGEAADAEIAKKEDDNQI
jgi:flagellar biosynthesis/type III secretory pathway protein FliH